ncbi:MAG TPA: MtrB/PioB family outer membrane beta-barrel protein [Vicinamibacteria bacterium]|nr:MtrB/PioB family outer membrane beta-barrel protein [Vicinamibacteria bacterium]
MKRIVTILALVALAFPAFAADEVKTTEVESRENESREPAAEPAASDDSKQDVRFSGPIQSGQESPVEAQEGADYSLGVVTIGLWQRDADTVSSKFLEYRDIPNGAQAPFLRFQGKSGDYRYDFIGHDVSQKDQKYLGLFEGKKWNFHFDYTGIPHAFGNGGRSILIPDETTERTEWRISDTLQSSFQDSVAGLSSVGYPQLLAIVQPTLDTQPNNIDIKLQRNRTNLAFSLLPGDGNFNVDVTYFHERRTGDRTNHGTSFGFSNVVETTEPIKYVTQNFNVRARANGDWGVAFAGINVNDFVNRFDTFGWDNPWRVFDSTDPSAYTAPGNNSRNGSKTGLLGLPPDNEAWTINGGTTLMFGPRTRLTADLQFGQWKQNHDPFIPYTANTAIFLPSGENAAHAPLPANTLNGKIDVFAVNGFFTSKLTGDFRLNARYRFYQNDNKTPRIRFEEGYVRFDAAWEEIPRITVPFGWDSGYFDVYGTYDVGTILGLEVGYKYNKINREFRETEHTSENTIRGAADLRFGGGVLVRGLYEHGSRDFEHYDTIEGEEASFLEPESPAQQLVLRRYDQAKRDRDRVGAQVQYTAESGVFSVMAAYYFNKDKYDDTPVPCVLDSPFCPGGVQVPLGLQEAKFKTFSLDFDVSPSDAYTLYVFYSREDFFNFQTGRQSGANVEFNPASNWSSQVDDKIDSFGAGASFTLVPNAWFFDLFYRYQKVDGNNAFTAGTTLRPPSNPARDIPLYDDTKLSFISAQIRRKFAEAWTIGVGGFYEDYELRDTQTGSVLNYMPSSFFINADNGDYKGWVGWLNLTYSFSL